ncbi:MAG: hypothetical protein K6A36_07140, partial [Paludibacteraceae bacterium]|nr:hypothetical protein [Paludibacteraceae bacterium]
QTEDDDFPLYYEDLSDEWRERLDTLHTPVAATIWGFDGGYVRSISFDFQASTWYGVVRHNPADFTSSSATFSSATYRLQGDTIFGGNIYKVLRRDDGVYCGAIRKSADEQQVFYRPGEMNGVYEPSLGKEYLLYDFSVKEGDTVCAYNGFMDTSCEYYSERPIMAQWEVLSVRTIDGRKHIIVKDGNTAKEVEWIEGIGTRNLLFSRTMHCLTGYDSYWTLCAADSEGNILYSFDTKEIGVHNDCPDFYPLAIENVSTDSHTATKLIRDGQLLIRCNGKTYNAQGAEVK